MIALLLSVVVSTLLFSCFRLFPRFGVQLEEAVVINYIVASSLSIGLAGPVHAWGRLLEPSTAAGVVMGLAFLYMFKKMGECTQQLGMGVTAIATKMSMVLPMSVFILLDPADPITWQKAVAVVLAFPAVWLASAPSTKVPSPGIPNLVEGHQARPWVLPAIVFFGSGIIDLGFGWFSTAEHMTCDADRFTFSAVPYTVAAFIGMGRWLMREESKPQWGRSTIIGGIVLGIINVGSLFFLLLAYQSMPFPRSAIVPANNLGIVLATALAGIVLFRERPGSRNIVGWAFAITALMLLLLTD